MEVNDNNPTDEQVAEYSMNNAYLLLTNQKSLEDLLDDNMAGIYIPVNPVEEYKEALHSMIDEIIKYFEYTEEYEKCQELMELKILHTKK
jgi:hypothetical protein